MASPVVVFVLACAAIARGSGALSDEETPWKGPGAVLFASCRLLPYGTGGHAVPRCVLYLGGDVLPCSLVLLRSVRTVSGYCYSQGMWPQILAQ